MASKIPMITVPKEEAVFWMDKHGVWHNEHGRFEHPKMINYFNASIRKDGNGYHLYQLSDDFEEKVYFCHEDTALFVVDLTLGPAVELLLNNKTRMTLCPDDLYSCNDALYVRTPDHRIKFSDRALVKLSKSMEDKADDLFVNLGGTSYLIPDLTPGDDD
ncbi:MAG: MFS transporter permease [Desulfobacterium sp.]|nr:MFS transporter permease [Desulfobacterium sp.]